MRWRLLRRCLLFGLLGLVTAVVVAWGFSVRDQVWREPELPNHRGVAVVDDTIVWLEIIRRPGFCSERWLLDDAGRGDRIGYQADYVRAHGGAAYDDWLKQMRAQTIVRHGGNEPRVQPPPLARVDDRAALGPPVPLDSVASWPTSVWRISVGWPWLALSSGRRVHTTPYDPKLHKRTDSGRTVSYSNDVQVRWPWPKERASPYGFSLRAGPTSVRLPLHPRPGLLLNTIFYALLWALLLLAPGALRRRIRRARGRCPTCGYSLRGQPAAGCPECGHKRQTPLTSDS